MIPKAKGRGYHQPACNLCWRWQVFASTHLIQAFFTEIVTEDGFVPQRRKELRIRAGLRENEKHWKVGVLKYKMMHLKEHIYTTCIFLYSIHGTGAEVPLHLGGWGLHWGKRG